MNGYFGEILNNSGHSAELRQHVSGVIEVCHGMDELGLPVVPYLAAWKSNRKRIWYEYSSPRLAALLDCPQEDVARCMRERVIDRREFRYVDSVDACIEEQVITRKELREGRLDLRNIGVRKGGVEAIYKLGGEPDSIWLKDQAVIRFFEVDDIFLSAGCLTDVTKEMEQKELLERIGYYDELTCLPRRSIMNRLLEINIAQYCRGHLEDFCFILMDIDHFKRINDTYGHPAGDYVLATMAGIMNSAKRKEDELGRYGGEEFFALCQGGISTGLEFTERLRSMINDHDFVWRDARLEVRFSAGVAAASELPELSAEAIIQLADRRLYVAKENGRNRSVGA